MYHTFSCSVSNFNKTKGLFPNSLYAVCALMCGYACARAVADAVGETPLLCAGGRCAALVLCPGLGCVGLDDRVTLLVQLAAVVRQTVRVAFAHRRPLLQPQPPRVQVPDPAGPRARHVGCWSYSPPLIPAFSRRELGGWVG